MDLHQDVSLLPIVYVVRGQPWNACCMCLENSSFQVFRGELWPLETRWVRNYCDEHLPPEAAVFYAMTD